MSEQRKYSLRTLQTQAADEMNAPPLPGGEDGCGPGKFFELRRVAWGEAVPNVPCIRGTVAPSNHHVGNLSIGLAANGFCGEGIGLLQRISFGETGGAAFEPPRGGTDGTQESKTPCGGEIDNLACLCPWSRCHTPEGPPRGGQRGERGRRRPTWISSEGQAAGVAKEA